MTVSIVSNFDKDELLLRWEKQEGAPCEKDASEDLMAFAYAPVRRKVRFSADPVSECHEIEHINDFTDEEVANSWFSVSTNSL